MCIYIVWLSLFWVLKQLKLVFAFGKHTFYSGIASHQCEASFCSRVTDKDILLLLHDSVAVKDKICVWRRISGDYDGNKHIISEPTAVGGIQIHENARWKRDYDGNKHIISKPIVARGIQFSRECTFELWLLMNTNIIIKQTTVRGISICECVFKVWLMETKTSLVNQLWLAVFKFAWMHIWSVTLMETKMSLVYWPRSRGWGFKFTWMQIQSVTMMETKKSLGNWLRQLAWGIQTHANARSSCDFDGNKRIISKLTAINGIQIHVNASSKRDYHGNKHIIMKLIVTTGKEYSSSRECTFDVLL